MPSTPGVVYGGHLPRGGLREDSVARFATMFSLKTEGRLAPRTAGLSSTLVDLLLLIRP